MASLPAGPPPSLKRKLEEENSLERKKAKAVSIQNEDGMYIQITGRAGIVAEALCSPEDYEMLHQYTWNLTVDGYAAAVTPLGTSNMHRLVITAQSKAVIPAGLVVDHINGEKLDCRRDNLRVVTPSQNSQNRPKTLKAGVSSQYIGVSARLNGSRWSASCGGHYIGQFVSEQAAAWAYDQAAVLKYGRGARINGVDKPDGENIAPKLAGFNLARGVERIGNRWRAYHCVKRKRHNLGTFETFEEADAAAINGRAAEGTRREQELASRPIECNENGQAIIRTHTEQQVLVDAERWHELSKSKWNINTKGYVCRNVKKGEDGRQMHRVVIGETDPSVCIDHINHIRTDNRLCNLRRSTPSDNAHNKNKKIGTTSKYIGVTGRSGSWKVQISHKHQKERLGYYKDELVAAWVYDQRAKELYGEYANVNGVAHPEGWHYANQRGRQTHSV